MNATLLIRIEQEGETGLRKVTHDPAIRMIEEATEYLRKAATVEDVMKMCTQAEAIHAVTRKLNASEKAKKAALLLIVSAEIALGKLTERMPTAPTGRQAQNIKATGKKLVTKRDTLKAHGVSLGRSSMAEQLAKVPSKEVRKAISDPNTNSLTAVTEKLGLKKKYHAPSRAGMRELAFQAIGLLVQCCSEGVPPTKSEVDDLRRDFTLADEGINPMTRKHRPNEDGDEDAMDVEAEEVD